MATVQVHIKGLDSFHKALSKYPSIAGKHLQEAINTSGLEVTREAKKIAPFDTGNLVRKITPLFRPLTAIIDSRANYSFAVHEGTARWPLSSPARGGKERQFLKVAIERKKSEIERVFAKALENTFKEIKLKSKF